MNAYRAMMRKKLLEEIYDNLSPEDKRTFVQMTLQDKGYDEILQALSQQKKQLESIEKKQNWKVDFLSDISANFLTDGLIWLGSRIFKKL